MLHARLAALALLMAAPLAAQSDLQVVTLSHLAFLPHSSTTAYFSVCCGSPSDNYRYPTGGGAAFEVPLDASLIPNGARIVRIDAFVRDSTSEQNADLRISLCQSWVDFEGTPGGDCADQVDTAGNPGDTVVTMQPDHTVLYETDADGDGDTDSVAYTLTARFGTAGGHYTDALRLRGARILYQRQVSPAPLSATFNDVPTNHPFFQFVEALAASGITAGCGTGIYCPDSPLTRGQMAVFLAKALGLHWPAAEAP